jgi:hypothetical protein
VTHIGRSWPSPAKSWEDAAKHDQAKIVFDLDDSLRSWDRQQMIEFTRAAGVMDRIAYGEAGGRLALG